MALILADRVQETCNSPGTGTVTLLGAQTGFRSFLAGVGNGNTTYYAIADQVGANWEVGLGTYSSTGNTLTRTTVLASSNAGVLTNFSSGTQNIWVDYPAGKAVFQDSTGTVSVPVLLTTSTTSTTPNLSFNASNTGFSVGASVSGSYLQSLLQNKSGTAGASTNYVLSNDLGTDSSYYGEFGMNSSVYSSGTPTDFYSINNGIYFSGHDGDITFGSGNGFKSYFAWGTTGQSAHVINASGAIGFSTNLGTTPALSGTTGYGTAGQVPVSAGSAGAVAWSSTPTLTGTNFTGIPISTGISGLGTGIATWLTTPSSTNLLAAMTDKTGTGSLVFATSPSLTTPLLGTPQSGNFSTGTFTWPTFNQSTTGNAATATTANALNTANSYSGANFTGSGYIKGGTNANPAIPANYGLQATGSYGGGLSFVDGVYGIGLYSSGGTLNFAFGSNTSISAIANLTASGIFSTTSFSGAGTGLTGTANSLNAGLGVNQTWQNMLASRATGTTYTNSTGKPIVFYVRCLLGTGAYINLQVGGMEAAYISNAGGASSFSAGVSAIVPPGVTYSNVGNTAASAWSELR